MEFYREEYHQLLTILPTTPGITGQEDWEQLLRTAGVTPYLVSLLHLEGLNRDTAAGNIIDFLTKYGDDTLWQRFIDALILRFGQGTRAGLFLQSLKIRPKSVGEENRTLPYVQNTLFLEEALGLGQDPSHPIAILDKAKYHARAVALVRNAHRRLVGTGIMLTPSLLVTCRHVLPTIEDARQAEFIFNYQDLPGDTLEQPMTYYRQQSGVFHASIRLDYAIVELANAATGVSPGKEWAVATPAFRQPVEGEQILLVHHMRGDQKRIAFSKIATYRDPLMSYPADTMPGSSGGAIFTSQLQLLGLHEGSSQHQRSDMPFLFSQNQGLAIDAILADLPDELHQLLIAQV